jgi:hypothetical protein
MPEQRQWNAAYHAFPFRDSVIGSQASWGSSFVSWRALLRGLPKGVIKRGVLSLGVAFLGVEFLGVLLGTIWSGVSKGDLDNDGEWNCDGGADIGGVGDTEAGLGVTGVEFTLGLGVTGVEFASTTSPIFFFSYGVLLALP